MRYKMTGYQYMEFTPDKSNEVLKGYSLHFLCLPDERDEPNPNLHGIATMKKFMFLDAVNKMNVNLDQFVDHFVNIFFDLQKQPIFMQVADKKE